MKYDDVLELVGDFGPYQVFILTMLCLMAIPNSMNSLSGVFLIAEMDHWCSVDEWEEGVSQCYSLIESNREDYLQCIHWYRNSSIPHTVEHGEVSSYSKCEKYDAGYPEEWSRDYYASNYTTNTTYCDEGWVYDRTQYDATAVSEFDLVCGRKLLGNTAQSLMYLGFLAGAIILSVTADSISRRFLLVLTMAFTILSTAATAFSWNYTIFATLRFATGVFDVAMYDAAFLLGTELLSPSRRIFLGVLISLMYSVGYMLLALFAFFIRDWRKLQLSIAAVMLPYMLIVVILPESPRWLIAKKRVKEAVIIIRKIAKRNRTEYKLPPNLEELLANEKQISSEAESGTIIDIFRTPGLRLTTVIIMICSLSITMVFYGLAYNSVKLGTNDYIAFFLAGLVEFPAYLICTPLIESPLGRRWTTSLLEVSAGVACIVTAFMRKGVAKTAVAMVGKFFISAAYGIVYIYSAEVFPTVARGAGLGLCTAGAMVGTFLGPFVLAFSQYNEALPVLILGLTAILGGALVTLLPETRGVQLVDSLTEYVAESSGPRVKNSSADNEAKETMIGLRNVDSDHNACVQT